MISIELVEYSHILNCSEHAVDRQDRRQPSFHPVVSFSMHCVPKSDVRGNENDPTHDLAPPTMGNKDAGDWVGLAHATWTFVEGATSSHPIG